MPEMLRECDADPAPAQRRRLQGPAKGHCLNCMDEREYDLTVAVNSQRILTPIVHNG